MDSDVTADSLSSPENRIATSSGRRFSGALSSFSTLGPQDHGSSQRSCPPLDSFDLSTPIDASAAGGGGGFLDESHQQLSPGGARGLTPLSRQTRGSVGHHHEEGESDDRHPRRDDGDTRVRRSMSLRLPQSGSGEFDVGGDIPAAAAAASSSGKAHRKRSREDAMTDGHISRGWQQQPSNRLESSWPLSRLDAAPVRRSRSSNGGGSPLDLSHTDPSPPLSRQGTMNGSPHERYETSASRSAFGGDISGGGRERTDGGGEDCYTIRSRSEHDHSGSAGDSISVGAGIDNRMGGSMRRGGNDLSWNGSNSENLSISEESSRGLPAPPIVTSGPLPAIGALREVGRPF